MFIDQMLQKGLYLVLIGDVVVSLSLMLLLLLRGITKGLALVLVENVQDGVAVIQLGEEGLEVFLLEGQLNRDVEEILEF